MKRLHQIVGVLLLVLWAPITSHCTLETIPGLQFLKCAGDVEQKSDCADDACSQIETATYKTSNMRIDIPPPACTAQGVVRMIELPETEPLPASITASPEVFSGWRFALRAARPPRAPAAVS